MTPAGLALLRRGLPRITQNDEKYTENRGVGGYFAPHTPIFGLSFGIVFVRRMISRSNSAAASLL